MQNDNDEQPGQLAPDQSQRPYETMSFGTFGTRNVTSTMDQEGQRSRGYRRDVTDLQEIEDWGLFLLMGCLLTLVLVTLWPVATFVMTLAWVFVWALCVHNFWAQEQATQMLFLTPLWPMWLAVRCTMWARPWLAPARVAIDNVEQTQVALDKLGTGIANAARAPLSPELAFAAIS